MKYKVGDRVRIKSLDWYNMHCDDAGNVDCGCEIFEKEMKPYLGKVFTINRIVDNSKYEMEEAFDFFLFTDEMIEGLAEEEMPLDKAGQITDFEYEGLAYTLPDGYQFVDENGNVINTQKIVLEKKKKEYPKTFLKCCDVLNIGNLIERGVKGYKAELFDTLQKLYICRDAYWKIANDGEGWKPQDLRYVYSIFRRDNEIVLTDTKFGNNNLLEFPTEEMRDAFYENFKELIEQCKELL